MVNVGDYFETNSDGPVRVSEYGGCFNVRVVFTESGSEAITSTDQLKKGTVKDRYKRRIFGVGYIGGKVPSEKRVYQCWINMIRRCYDHKSFEKHPTYKDCFVCDEWHSFEVFYKWFIVNNVEGFDLDKDKIIKGNKEYSPSTCCFISKKENVQIAHSKRYRLENDSGEVFVVENLAKFCRDNGLQRSGLQRVENGERGRHKNWVKVNLIKEEV